VSGSASSQHIDETETERSFLPFSSLSLPLARPRASSCEGTTTVEGGKSEQFSRAEKMTFSGRSVDSSRRRFAARSRSRFCRFLSLSLLLDPRYPFFSFSGTPPRSSECERCLPASRDCEAREIADVASSGALLPRRINLRHFRPLLLVDRFESRGPSRIPTA
jgi:hypothetical protein